jgi:MFS family permease
LPRGIASVRGDFGLGRSGYIVFWAMVFNEASFGFYQTLMPLYIESLGASPGLVGLVIGISGLIRLCFLIPAGTLAERLPLRPLIIGGRGVTILGTLLYFVAQEWWHLLPAMVLMAAGNVVWPAISKVIADSTHEGNRTRAFTLIYTVGPSVAMLLSPAIGGVMADRISLRSIFLAAAVSQIIAVVLFSRLRPAEHHEGVRVTRTYREALSHRPVQLIALLQFCVLLVLTTGFTLVPNFLEDERGLSAGTIGQLGSLVAVCSVLLGIVIAKVKLFAQPLNALLLSASFSPLAYILFIGGDATWLFALAFFCRGGYLVSWGIFYAALGEVTPDHLRARAFALLELLGGAGFALAPFVAGALYEVGPTMPIWASLIAYVPLVLAIVWVKRVVRNAVPVAP